MSKWYVDTRFSAFAIEFDVFIDKQDDRYLYVINQPATYNGDYECNEYKALTDYSGNFTQWLRYDTSAVCDEYLANLEKAPHDIALDIVCGELRNAMCLANEEPLDDDDYRPTKDMILDAIRCLKEYAKPDEKFEYC